MTRSIFGTMALLAATTGALTACAEPARAPDAAMAGGNVTDMQMADGSPVDMTIVPLYPGAKMIDMKIMPHKEDDMTDVAFDSAADSATVRAWYLSTLEPKGFTLKAEGTALVGTDPVGKPVRIDVTPTAGGHSTGVISRG